MAFTRKFLSALKLEAEQIDEIMTAHVEVVDHYKTQLDDVKQKNSELETLKAEKADLTAKLKEAQDKVTAYEKDDYKGKYESEKAEHDKLKADVAGKETLAKKENAFRNGLKSKKYSDEAIKLIIGKGGYTGKIELDKDGNPTNLENIFKEVQEDFAMFTPKETTKSQKPDNPPANVGGTAIMSKKDIMAIKDSTERQKAIREAIEGGSDEFKI